MSLVCFVTLSLEFNQCYTYGCMNLYYVMTQQVETVQPDESSCNIS